MSELLTPDILEQSDDALFGVYGETVLIPDTPSLLRGGPSDIISTLQRKYEGMGWPNGRINEFVESMRVLVKRREAWERSWKEKIPDWLKDPKFAAQELISTRNKKGIELDESLLPLAITHPDTSVVFAVGTTHALNETLTAGAVARARSGAERILTFQAQIGGRGEEFLRGVQERVRRHTESGDVYSAVLTSLKPQTA